MLEYEEELALSSNTDPKRLHTHVRSKQRVKDLIRSIETTDGETTAEHEVICSTLNNYFQFVFVLESEVALPTFEPRTNSVCAIDERTFAIAEVMNRLRGLP